MKGDDLLGMEGLWVPHLRYCAGWVHLAGCVLESERRGRGETDFLLGDLEGLDGGCSGLRAMRHVVVWTLWRWTNFTCSSGSPMRSEGRVGGPFRFQMHRRGKKRILQPLVFYILGHPRVGKDLDFGCGLLRVGAL